MKITMMIQDPSSSKDHRNEDNANDPGELTGSEYPSLNWTEASAACRNNSITR